MNVSVPKKGKLCGWCGQLNDNFSFSSQLLSPHATIHVLTNLSILATLKGVLLRENGYCNMYKLKRSNAGHISLAHLCLTILESTDHTYRVYIHQGNYVLAALVSHTTCCLRLGFAAPRGEMQFLLYKVNSHA